MRILVVEDDRIINGNLSRFLTMNGYAVDSAMTQDEALSKIDYSPYDIILLDLSLPQGSGIEILKQFRKANKTSAVIIISARDSKKIIKSTLEYGADDYMVKPIDMEELISRIHAVTRRMSTPLKGLIELGNIRIDRDKVLVEQYIENKKEWTSLELTKKEFSIIEYLGMNKGKVISQEELIEHVWDENADPFSGAIRTHIKNLRKKTGSIIDTVKGVGYVIK